MTKKNLALRNIIFIFFPPSYSLNKEQERREIKFIISFGLLNWAWEA